MMRHLWPGFLFVFSGSQVASSSTYISFVVGPFRTRPRASFSWVFRPPDMHHWDRLASHSVIYQAVDLLWLAIPD